MTAEQTGVGKKSKKRKIFDYAMIAFASFVYASGISLFLDPNDLAPGGLTGIAIIGNRLSGIETGSLIFLFNIPLMLLAVWKFGGKFIISTAYAILLVSAFTNLLAPIGAVTKEPILAAISGSVLVAVGIGLIFRAGATTGGTDIIVKLLKIKFPHLKTGFLFFSLDLIIVTISGFIFKELNVALYALIAVMLMAVVLDVVLYGTDEAKLIYIISECPTQITVRLLEEIDIGVTYLHGEGGFSNQDKKVIMCVLKKQQAPRVEAIVKEEDPAAFMIVSHATEIYGEGYKNFFSEKL